jgi:3-hydroxybutyryl-CoA dehydratase
VTTAEFQVDVTLDSARAFAELSGDWNPLHTDASYAATTSYHTPILHGAFSAGLFSRMAGMHLPGTECLLHSLQLKFLAPISPPKRLVIAGRVVADSGDVGQVAVTVSDASTGLRYVEGSYGFGRHKQTAQAAPVKTDLAEGSLDDAVLVTGASGALARSVLERLGDSGIGMSRSASGQINQPADYEDVPSRVAFVLGRRRIRAIVHCAWPAPDNQRLLDHAGLRQGIAHYIAEPLQHAIVLARLLREHGTERAQLILIGSTAADPGRHNFKAPLYALGKTLVPALTQILAVELGATNHRVNGVVFDVIDGGMSGQMSRAARVAHTSRTPSGTIPTTSDAAEQLIWLLQNDGIIASGAVISLTGGAMP